MKGYKTILGAVGLGVVVVLHALGWIDDIAFEVLMGVLGAFTGISLRLAIKK